MKVALSVFVAFFFCRVAIASEISSVADAGRKAEQQSCTPCHSLRLVDSQRLSAAAWTKEIHKMIGWGARVPDEKLLLDYLSQNYGDTKPVPSPEVSVASGK